IWAPQAGQPSPSPYRVPQRSQLYDCGAASTSVLISVKTGSRSGWVGTARGETSSARSRFARCVREGSARGPECESARVLSHSRTFVRSHFLPPLPDQRVPVARGRAGDLDGELEAGVGALG